MRFIFFFFEIVSLRCFVKMRKKLKMLFVWYLIVEVCFILLGRIVYIYIYLLFLDILSDVINNFN